MKKVLAIAPYAYLPYYSGGQKFIAEFLQYLAEKTELTVISVPANDFSLAKNYRAVPLLKPSFSRYYDRSLVKKISERVRTEGIETIIWEHPYYAWLAFRVRKRTGVRTIIHTHNIEYQRFRSMGRWWWPVLKSYERRCFRKADGILFITPEDREFAINSWHISRDKCFDLPFGTPIRETPADRASCREELGRIHGLRPDEKIFLFTGLLSYKPNLDALKVILEEIAPRLRKQVKFPYRIIVCGKGLPESMNGLKDYEEASVLYAGFIAEIETYYKAADVFLNPVQSGGGIKTKMVEAIAYGTTVISTTTGATGMDPSICGEKLVVVRDNDWSAFATAIQDHQDLSQETPSRFYDQYNWEKIIARLVQDAI